MMTHLIRRQYLHVDLAGSESDGLALQQTLPVLCRNWLTPAIEASLDRHAPADRYLSIDRLEVDAGTLAIGELEDKLAESVTRALEKSILEKVRLAASQPGAAVQEAPLHVKVHEAFIHFLDTGLLPWSFPLSQGTGLEEAVLQSWKEPATRMAANNRKGDILSCLASPPARARLIRQFTHAFLKKLLSMVSPDAEKALSEVLDTVETFFLPPAAMKELERALFDQVLISVARGEVASGAVVFKALEAIAATALGSPELATALAASRLEAPEGSTTPEPDPRKANEEHKPLRLVRRSGDSPPPADDGFRALAADRAERVHAAAVQGLYVENAGCILLHPFLPLFFETLGVAADAELLQPERALCLLHFLVTGEARAPEYETTLLKILCNIALEAPVEADVALTACEREEGEAVLRAAIGHWDALRSTSPDGLRGAFLLRPGKLSLRENGDWLLQVEARTCDVLLDRLPWGVSMVKLPWMETMLWAEWR